MPKGDSGANEEYNKMMEMAREAGKKTGNEYVGIIDNLTGQAVGGGLHTSDKSGEVLLTPTMIDAILTSPENSLDMIHNHPLNTSFGEDDLSFAEFPSMRSTAIIGHDGTKYEMVFSGGQRVQNDEVQKSWIKEFNRTQKPYAEKILSGELSYNDARKQHFHEINQALASEYGWTYRRLS
jgi:hypothetical protein